MRHLILYSKPGCHLCQRLQEKLEQIEQIGNLEFDLEVRDITNRDDWFAAYQYEVPVMCQNLSDGEKLLPRPSPRASVQQLEKMLRERLEQV